MDTRTKILTPAALAALDPPRPMLLAAGRFDILRAGEHAECGPCLLRECPIDHRSMTAVTVERTAAVALELWKETASAWTPELKS